MKIHPRARLIPELIEQLIRLFSRLLKALFLVSLIWACNKPKTKSKLDEVLPGYASKAYINEHGEIPAGAKIVYSIDTLTQLSARLKQIDYALSEALLYTCSKGQTQNLTECERLTKKRNQLKQQAQVLDNSQLAYYFITASAVIFSDETETSLGIVEFAVDTGYRLILYDSFFAETFGESRPFSEN